MSALIFTCKRCKSIVDYSCACPVPPPISELTGHDSVADAKAHVLEMSLSPPDALPASKEAEAVADAILQELAHDTRILIMGSDPRAAIAAALSTAIPAGDGVPAWHPIETAPRDGTEVLGFWSYLYIGDRALTTGMDVISWERNLIPDSDAEGWVDRDGLCADGVFTHWQPLPNPPANPHEGG